MEFTVKTSIEASAKAIYEAWLSSEGHSQMTGGEAFVSGEVGASFSAWDGYISGKNIRLEPHTSIIQSWRTTEFAEQEADSRIEVTLNEQEGFTELTLKHTNLPTHGEQYRKGWEDHYFIPMQAYFNQNKS